MGSKIYVCKKYRKSEFSFGELIYGERYIIQEFEMPRHYTIIRIKDNSTIDSSLIIGSSLSKEFIDFWFKPIEKVREDKLNILFDGI